MRRASIYYMPESGLILYQILNTSIIGGGETEKCIELYQECAGNRILTVGEPHRVKEQVYFKEKKEMKEKFVS